LEISFVVPAYNSEKTISKCLESIRKLKIKKEIIVVDDGSTDKTNQIAKKYTNKVIRIKNSGPAKARNIGVDISKHDIVALIDSDVVLTNNWLKETIKNIKKYDFITSSRWMKKKFEKELKLDLNYFCPPSDFFIFKKESFKKVGGFSKLFPWAAGEDTDILIRYIKYGYKCKHIFPKYQHLGKDKKIRKRLIKFWISNLLLDIKHIDTKIYKQWILNKLCFKFLKNSNKNSKNRL